MVADAATKGGCDWARSGEEHKGMREWPRVGGEGLGFERRSV